MLASSPRRYSHRRDLLARCVSTISKSHSTFTLRPTLTPTRHRPLSRWYLIRRLKSIHFGFVCIGAQKPGYTVLKALALFGSISTRNLSQTRHFYWLPMSGFLYSHLLVLAQSSAIKLQFKAWQTSIVSVWQGTEEPTNLHRDKTLQFGPFKRYKR